MVEFTKVNKIYEVNNDMVHNYYYMYYGRIINNDRTKYRKFKFILWFDIFDILEYFEQYNVSKNDIKEYANILTSSVDIPEFDNIEKLKDFYKWCNNTIQDYNNLS